MDQPHTSGTDDQGTAPQNDQGKQLADGERGEVMARLRERFSFSG